jgi:MFS transporter, DHA1 family, inner membrane transport protein
MFGGFIGGQVYIISDSFPYERSGAAKGSVMSAFAIASTLGVPFALYLAKLLSWHGPFILVGSLGFVMIPFLFRYVPSMTGHILNGSGEKDWKCYFLSYKIQNRSWHYSFLL